ncbi:DUF4907 domain-containing protein [Maribacter sp. HTCC2170]|uniref:DUF4907 domain-containing protein n=1 Tax=Maribacter sp. (strain HTCC2170 / KCCM 42371) TaxID=313603 RepID=UPI00006B4750|nr:DUF4907 domain-containing protein [Maribacter sp. HTCC2170]EAR01899.1 hypothetical protein FB2170_15263 [Maribacter sp. HTCC2170]
MRKIVSITVISFLLFFAFYDFIKPLYKQEINGSGYHSKVFKLDCGYGYQILHNKKVLIKQEYIPAIQEKKSFSSYEDAELVGKFVSDKFLKGESPVITIDELNNLDIVTLGEQ